MNCLLGSRWSLPGEEDRLGLNIAFLETGGQEHFYVAQRQRPGGWSHPYLTGRFQLKRYLDISSFLIFLFSFFF